MIKYSKIDENDIVNWNSKLLETNASYFQYPYYGSGYQYMPSASVSYFKITSNDAEIAFISIVNIKVAFLKIGLIIRGPVTLVEGYNKEIVEGIKKILKGEKYFFIRINTSINCDNLNTTLSQSKGVIPIDYFPIYKGAQQFDLIIKNEFENEEQLLKSYKPRARQSIRYAEEEGFEIMVTSNQEYMDETYEIFKTAAKNKEFSYRPLKSYKEILEQGGKLNLVKLYTAKKDGQLVNALYIVKDNNCFTYFSGALVEGNYKPRNSPAALLHHKAIVDCLFNEKKEYYNLSYSSPNHSVYTFKSSFNPIEVKYPYHYTILGNRLSNNVFYLLVSKLTPNIKGIIKKKKGNK
jgi:hypothetical protein